MKLLISTLLVLGTFAVSPVLAVDNSISPLCVSGSEYTRAGGFCDAVAGNKTMLPQNSSDGCYNGEVANPNAPPKCIPEDGGHPA